MKTVVTVKKIEGYTIVKYNGMFWGIKDKYIKEGITTKQLNGVQGNIAETVESCEELCNNQLRVDKLVENGIDRVIAVVMVAMNMNESEAMVLAQELI